jgi:uncharacterized protein (TIGR00369 family)
VPAAINPEVTPESIRARIDGTFPGDLGVDRRHLHPGGYVHGGAWVALADSVAAWGTFRHLSPGYDFTTIELKLNVFAAAGPGEELVATAEAQHIGRRTQVWVTRAPLDSCLRLGLCARRAPLSV